MMVPNPKTVPPTSQGASEQANDKEQASERQRQAEKHEHEAGRSRRQEQRRNIETNVWQRQRQSNIPKTKKRRRARALALARYLRASRARAVALLRQLQLVRARQLYAAHATLPVCRYPPRIALTTRRLHDARSQPLPRQLPFHQSTHPLTSPPSCLSAIGTLRPFTFASLPTNRSIPTTSMLKADWTRPQWMTHRGLYPHQHTGRQTHAEGGHLHQSMSMLEADCTSIWSLLSLSSPISTAPTG